MLYVFNFENAKLFNVILLKYLIFLEYQTHFCKIYIILYTFHTNLKKITM